MRPKATKSKGKTPRKHLKDEEAKDVNEDEGSDVEGDENVFIDNLPKDEQSIKILLKEVNRHIRDLERKFFEEEDSDAERDIQRHLHTPSACKPEFETNPKIKEKLKEKSHIQQFWSIPLSENVTSIDFDQLAAAQMQHGGRLFDVVTMDPPW